MTRLPEPMFMDVKFNSLKQDKRCFSDKYKNRRFTLIDVHDSNNFCITSLLNLSSSSINSFACSSVILYGTNDKTSKIARSGADTIISTSPTVFFDSPNCLLNSVFFSKNEFVNVFENHVGRCRFCFSDRYK